MESTEARARRSDWSAAFKGKFFCLLYRQKLKCKSTIVLRIGVSALADRSLNAINENFPPFNSIPLDGSGFK